MSRSSSRQRESRGAISGVAMTVQGFRMRTVRQLLLSFAVLFGGLQATATAQYPNPNYDYLPYPTLHPYKPMVPQQGPAVDEPEMVLPFGMSWLYDDDSRPDLIIRETLRRSYLRAEYLNWNIEHPGNNLLSAPIPNVENPREPFLVETATQTLGVAEVMSTGGVDFSEINGMRMTLGLPLVFGTLEGSVWGLEEGYHTIQDKPFLRNNGPSSPRFIAMGLLTAGDPGGRLLLFDKSFKADYKASAWGSDVNMYYSLANPREGFGFQPLAGFRFFNYDETLGMRGEFDNSSGMYQNFGVLPTPFESEVRSAVNNNVYALQVGFKADLKHEYFTLAFEPKLAFGANDYQARVMTNNLRTFDDPTIVDGPNDIVDGKTFSVTGRSVFSPTIDLGFAAKMHLTEWAHLRVGYNIIWTGGIARADRAINYLDNGLANPPAISARQRTDSLLIQGLTVGAEFVLP